MKHLVSIPANEIEAVTYRYASQQRPRVFFDAEGYDEAEAAELLDLLKSDGLFDTLEELIEAPFRRKPQLDKLRLTRYSDGSFPVFYSALEVETAKAEITYWFRRFVGSPADPRTAFYSRFSCEFDGKVKDVRPKKTEWSDLTHDTDYTFCNGLAAEAKDESLDALLAPSARRSTGSNLPVFERKALSNPTTHKVAAVTFEPVSGKVAIREI